MTASGGGTYKALIEQISASRLMECAGLMGVAVNGDTLVLPFFNRIYRVSPCSIEDIHGNAPTESVGTVLSRYLLQFPSLPQPEGRMVTFRELSGAGPLVSSFARNTNKLIASAFAGDLEALIARSVRLNGKTQLTSNGWDVSVRFQALPHLPVFLRFNAADDQFQAQCNLLFFQSAEQYLDMKSLFVIGTWLAGNLISERTDSVSG